MYLLRVTYRASVLEEYRQLSHSTLQHYDRASLTAKVLQILLTLSQGKEIDLLID